MVALALVLQEIIVASIRQRPDGAWRARYRDDAGKEHARHFKLKRDAQRWLDEVTTAQLVGRYVDPRAGRITFKAYATGWLSVQTHRAQTNKSYESRLRNSVYPVIGDMELDKIRPSTLQGLMKKLTHGDDEQKALAPSTVLLVRVILRAIFNAAVQDRKIPESPMAGIRTPQVMKTRVRPLTDDQVVTLRKSMPAELQALVTFMAGTGLRPGEAIGVTRDRLRLLGKNPTVTVDRQLLTQKGKTTDFGPLKNRPSYRTVPLSRIVVAALNQHIARNQVPSDGLLFTLAGKPITTDTMRHLLDPIKSVVGMTPETGTGLHALRHYYASLLIRHGESVKTVQANLGHASAVETLDTYAHLWPDSDDRTREAVDSALGALADSARTSAE